MHGYVSTYVSVGHKVLYYECIYIYVCIMYAHVLVGHKVLHTLNAYIYVYIRITIYMYTHT